MLFSPKFWLILSTLSSLAFAAPESLLLSGFESPIARDWRHVTRANLVPFVADTAPAKVKSGQSSGRWSDLERNKWIALVNTPTDWSAYEALSLWIHSETANGQKFNLTVSAPSEQDELGYYHHQIVVDWVGWKQVVVPFSTFKANRSPAPWSQVTELRLTAGGWSAEPLADTVLHLDELFLVRR